MYESENDHEQKYSHVHNDPQYSNSLISSGWGLGDSVVKKSYI
ncbi:hypothetical protein ACHOLT_17425 [Desulfitobacterium sp. Sab5]